MSTIKRPADESEHNQVPPEKRSRVDPKAGKENDSSDDDIPISQLLKKQAATANQHKATHADSDSDDDIPISDLLKRKQMAEAVAKVKKQGKPKMDSSATPSSKSTTSTKPPKGATKPADSSDLSAAYYNDTLKGTLVQKLLVRWWYAISWPDEKAISAPVPEGYEPLDGFPGVFVSTSEASMGTILDRRDKASCPSLRNLSTKPASELKELCVLAIEEQIKQLVEAEGTNTSLERELKAELREVKGISGEKAEREAAKRRKLPFS